MDDITARPDDDPRRGRQPALQLGPPSAGARHHGRRFRGARRLPAHAPLPARPRAGRARGLRSRRAAVVRRQQHPLRHLDQDRRMGARQAFALDAAAARRRSDPVGLRLGGGPSQALFAVAQAGELQGRPRRLARHGRSRLRPDEASRRGNGVDPQIRRRRQNADRRRHHRTADDVRTGKGRAEGQGRPAGHARSARGQIGRRDRAAQPRRRDGRRRLRSDRREAAARRARERHRRAWSTSSSIATAPTTSKRSTPFPASAAIRIRTISPTA